MALNAGCDSCAVRHRALCGAVSSEELARISAISSTRTYVPGEQIFSDTERPDFFANIISGVVKLSKVMQDGRQQIVGLQFSSDFIGRPFSARNPFLAEAASEVTLCSFSARRFEALVREIPDLEHRMFQHTLDELDAARDWMVLLGRKSAEERIASFLALIVTRARTVGCQSSNFGPSIEIELPLTRADIADYLGLTIETVSRQFTSLKRRGVLETHATRRIFIPDVDALMDVAGESVEPVC